MLKLQELRTLITSMPAAEFNKQMGPFALIQRPPYDLQKSPWSALVGTTRASADQIQQGMFSLLYEFNDLCVATLPPMEGVEELTVGRYPDSDLFIDAPSVSKQHARLRWDAENNFCSVMDLGSTNGTFVDGCAVNGEAPLHDGDIISFGDEHYWYLLGSTLYRILSGFPAKAWEVKPPTGNSRSAS